jgi:fructosamine-3-kinase
MRLRGFVSGGHGQNLWFVVNRSKQQVNNLVMDPQPDLMLTTSQAERVLEAWQGAPVACSKVVPLEGGMMNSVFLLDFDAAPHRAVVKLHGAAGDPFASEARALDYLRSETACPAPAVYLHDNSTRLIPHAFLLIEHLPGVCLKGLDLGPAERDGIEAQLAAVLGELHDHKGEQWGAIGTDQQSVTDQQSATWAGIFVARLRDARAHPALADRLAPDVLARVDNAIEVAGSMLHDSGGPTLVHGDVWEGNLMVRLEEGRWRLTGLLDPDLQFADVELELAYLEVFDHQRTAFFNAYADHQTLRAGYRERRLFYWLHTALIHVALFGDEFFCEFTARTAASIGDLQTR